MAFLLFGNEEVAVAEFVVLVPERRRFADGGAKMKHRHDRLAGDAERQHRRGVMMADHHDIAARLIDAAVNDALGIERRLGGLHRLGIERVSQNIVRLDQERRARAREEITARIGRMAHANVTEGVEHAFMGENSIGQRKLGDEVGRFVRHGRVLEMAAASARLPAELITSRYRENGHFGSDHPLTFVPVYVT